MIFQSIAPVVEHRLPLAPLRTSALDLRSSRISSCVSISETPPVAKSSWLRRLCQAALSAWPSSARRPVQPCDLERRRDLLAEARSALLLHQIDDAEMALMDAMQIAGRDAACLNLQGIIHERRHEWRLAQRCYGRAMRADRRYAPAEQNLRRLYELWTFGKSRLPVAMGDVPSGQ